MSEQENNINPAEETAAAPETAELDEKQLDGAAGGILIGMLLPAVQKVRG